MENFKKKFTDVKNRIVDWAKNDPGTAATIVFGLGAGLFQLLTAITKFQNARTWRREVTRREKLMKNRLSK